MIATNIDGSSGGGQVLDLLSLLASDPKTYTAKLKELQDATTRHQEYVEAIGPVSQIVQIKEEIASDKIAAKEVLAKAKAKANTLVDDAQTQADAILAEAQDAAQKITENAKSLETAAAAALGIAQAAQNDAQATQKRLDAALEETKAKNKSLDIALVNAKQSQIDAEQIKDDILNKHQAFVQSL